MITRQELVKLDEQMRAAKKRHSDARRAFAIQQYPIEIGQEVIACGHTHKGKKMVVDAILPANFSFQGDWRVSGKVKKNDGSIGRQDAEFSEAQWRIYNND
ncbi:MAG TPA: hypothetical protein DCZ12_07260 [Gammaproteobacteria bacterium]|nr:hypothetical protein [Gammaproteobacteria bacterium]